MPACRLRWSPKPPAVSGLPRPTCANLIRRAAFYSVPLPLAETMIANRLWTDAGGEPLEGAATLGPTNHADRLTVTPHGNGWRLKGVAHARALGIAGDRLDICARCRRQTGVAAPRARREWRRLEKTGDATWPTSRGTRLRFDDIELASDAVRAAPAISSEDGLMPFGAAIRVAADDRGNGALPRLCADLCQ